MFPAPWLLLFLTAASCREHVTSCSLNVFGPHLSLQTEQLKSIPFLLYHLFKMVSPVYPFLPLSSKIKMQFSYSYLFSLSQLLKISTFLSMPLLSLSILFSL